MSLVPSLLQAIVRVDGEALVMHVGEKPYVVSPHGQIDLATRGLTFEAVSGLVAQLLPPDAMRSLEEVGATQFPLPPFPEFPGEHFTVTAARGGDDVWAEIRRHPAHEAELVPPDLFAAFNPPEPPPAAATDDLDLPRETQLWPAAQSPYAVADQPVTVETVPETAADVPAAADVPNDVPAPVTDLPAETPALTMPLAQNTTPAIEAVPATEPRASEAPDATSSQQRFASWLAAFSAQQMFVRNDASLVLPASTPASPAPAPVDATRIVTEPVADSAANMASGLAPAGGADMVPPPETEPPVVITETVVPVADAAGGLSAPDLAHQPEPVEAAEAEPTPPPVAAPVPHLTLEPVAEPVAEAVAEPVTSPLEPEPSLAAEPLTEPVVPVPAIARLETPAEPEVSILADAARVVDSESDALMSTPSPDFHPFVPVAPAPTAPADVPAAVPARPASFVPFPSLVDQPQPAVVLPIARSGRDAAADEQNAAPLERLLRLAAARGASALYLSSGARPSARLDGDVQTLDGTAVLAGPEIEALLLGAAPEQALDAVRSGAGEWVWELADVGSVRCTTFRDHRGPGAVFRIVVARPQSAAQLGLSREIQSLAAESEGLVLVTGPRASGKSTLISSLVDLINRTRRDYVITIESEVNVVHERQGAFISQREARGGSEEAAAMARAALREDPDILVIDDLRTSALLGVALDAAANGQLVIGGVPAHHATGALERLIELHQPEQRRQVQLSMAQNLRGVVGQVLLRKSGGGRVAAREVLLNSPIVASLLAEGRTSQLPTAIEGGRKSGMVPLNDALVGFVQSGAVDVREAYRRSADRGGLLELLKRQGIDTSVVERLA